VIPYLRQYIVPAAYAVLPPKLNIPAATALLLAIAQQESDGLRRRQLGGPARGFWQFERGGIAGVRSHHLTGELLEEACRRLCYPRPISVDDAYVAIEHNDVLACVFARLLLYTLPQALPGADEPDRGWDCYYAAWRPGTPRPEPWRANFARGWELA
jgi:hypothetical protein